MKKRWIASVLLVAMLVTMIPMAAQAEESVPEVVTSGGYEGFTWEIKDRVLTISGTGEMPTWGDYDYPWKDNELQERYDTVVISEGVTSIADSAFSNTGVRKAVFASTVKRIGNGAFEYCSLMEEIDITEGVEEVGEFAFFCNGAEVVRLPSTLRYIGASAFEAIGQSEDSVTVIYIPSMEMWMNVSMDTENGGIYASPLMSMRKVYIGGEIITDVIIPKGVTKIGDAQFCGFGDMTSLFIPDSVTEIGELVFYCVNIEDVIFPASVETIGEWGFQFGYLTETSKILVLNPDCVFADNQYIMDDYPRATLYGYAGSTSETIAAEYGMEFVAITDYTITMADDTANPGQDLAAACDGSADKLDGVYVNRKRLDTSCYIVSDDGTVTLTSEYLSTLPVDSYELLLWYTDGVAFADFFVSSQEEVTYTVSYYLLPDGDEILEPQTKIHGEDLTLLREIPKRESDVYNFLGWDADGDSKTVEYLPGAVYTLDADLTLIAVWECWVIDPVVDYYECSVPIRFSGVGTDHYQHIGVPTAITFYMQEEAPYRVSLLGDFSGSLRRYENGSLKDQTQSTQYPRLEVKGESCFTFHVHGPTEDWTGTIDLRVERGSYVTYDANGGTGAPEDGISYFITGMVLSDVIPTREDAGFLGWATSADAAEPEYQPGDTFITGEATTLYAVWDVEETVLYGDVNSDGKVNAQDRLYLTRYLAGMSGYTEDMIDLTAADVNCDGVVNPKDRLILTRYLAQWADYPSLPCEG